MGKDAATRAIFPDGPDEGRLQFEGDKLLFRLRESVEVDGRRLRATASIGVVVHPHNGATADTLLEHADTAMFDCKQSTGNAYRFFESEMDLRLQERRRLEHDLRRALSENQLELHWPDRHFVPAAVRDYCMFSVPSSASGGAMVTGAGGRYPRAE